jgi:hypothetical protein
LRTAFDIDRQPFWLAQLGFVKNGPKSRVLGR